MNAQQAPIGSGFNRDTTAKEALGGADLTGKTVIVTGGASGIGLETTRVLSGAGAQVIVAVRSPGRAREALNGLKRVEIEQLNLADPASIDAFAERFNATGRPLHILINNAGVSSPELHRDSRGNELHFTTNHLGHYHLTMRLWPALAKAKGARVVTLSSGAHRTNPLPIDDVNFERNQYEGIKAYGQSKAANVLFTVGLDARGAPHGIRAFAANPGVVPETPLASQSAGSPRRATLSAPKTIAQGASTSVWCATSPALAGKGGLYCENTDVAEISPPERTTPGGVREHAIDHELADRLWALSEKLTGVKSPV